MKILGGILALILLTVFIVHIARDSIALRSANTFLKDSDVEIIQISGSSFDTTSVTAKKVVALIGASSRIELQGIRLPTNFSTAATRDIEIERVIYATTNETGESASLADNLRAYLGIHEISPNTNIRIGVLDIPSTPSITNIDWSTTATSAILRAVIGDYEVLLVNSARDEADSAEFKLVHKELGVTIIATLDVVENNTAAELEGKLQYKLSAAVPAMMALDVIPEELTVLSGNIRGSLRIHLPNESSEPVAIEAILNMDSQLVLEYKFDEGSQVRVSTDVVAPISVSANYPQLDWMASTESASAFISLGDFHNQPVQFSKLVCRSGIECSTTLSGNAKEKELGSSSFESVSFNVPIAIALNESVGIDLGGESHIEFSDFRSGSLNATRISIERPGSAHIKFTDTDWRASVESANVHFGGIGPTPEVDVSGTLRILNLILEVDDEHTELSASLSTHDLASSYQGVHLSDVSLSGDIQIDNDDLHTQLNFSTLGDEFVARITTDSKLSIGATEVSLDKAVLDFDTTTLSGLLEGWPLALDFAAGQIEVAGELQLDEHSKSGRATLIIDKLSGAYDDIAFIDFDTSIVMNMNKDGVVSSQSGPFSLSFLDAGIQAENINGITSISENGNLISVEQLGMEILGGSIDVEPFVYSNSQDSNACVLQADRLQLSEIADFAELTSFDVEGSVSGEIPVQFGTDGITVAGGILKSNGAGGAIRYISEVMSDDSSETAAASSQLGIVTKSLSNFEFSSLMSEVSYGDDGNLIMQTRLSGINPDVDPMQPIVLNLRIENNIPQLMRSLQATRSIEQILERRAAH